MMVRFEKDRYIIEVKAYDPQESWLQLHSAICGLIRNIEQDNIMDNFFVIPDFLDNMMPDYRHESFKIIIE